MIYFLNLNPYGTSNRNIKICGNVKLQKIAEACDNIRFILEDDDDKLLLAIIYLMSPR